MLQRDKRNKHPPCALCGKESELDCWQYALCVKCHGLWVRDVGPPPCHFEEPTITVTNGQREVTWHTPPSERLRQWSEATEKWLRDAKARAA
jgi:hypothetical protein